MKIHAYAEAGFAGKLVSVEVDIRRGIPSIEIVGLPDSAVRESRDRVRVAIRRSGFDFPMERILVNLSPAGLKKEGASYDLPIAVGILVASGQINNLESEDFLCAGELLLDGSVRPVPGVLPAVAAALDSGIRNFVVPETNRQEASALSGGKIFPLSHLKHLPAVLEQGTSVSDTDINTALLMDACSRPETAGPVQDLSEIRGQGVLRRGLEIAAAGGHHLLIFGPPGSGKTMAARALEGLLPDLDVKSALDVTRIWSQAGRIDENAGMINRPPFREPHHSSSAEGLIGGGGGTRPGEVSLAHCGVLFLDESPEFGSRVLQSLREPLESGRVDMARAGRIWWYPSKFQLVMAMNPCPCGNMGREDAPCLCTPPEIHRHWRKLGGALMDRIDIRIPVAPVDPQRLLEPEGETSAIVAGRVATARERQLERFTGMSWKFNNGIPPGEINRQVPLEGASRLFFTEAVRKLGFSSRAAHGVLKVARTLADLANRDELLKEDILEALQHRRYGDRDLLWSKL